MKKLLQAQINNVKKEVGLILLIPLITALAFWLFSIGSGFSLFSKTPVETVSVFFFVLGIILSLLAYGGIFLLVLIRDHKAFFGDGASFYSALPIPPGQVLTARYLYYLVIGLCSFLINSISQLILFYSLSKVSAMQFNLKELTNGLGYLWNQLASIPLPYYLLFLLVVIISIFYQISLYIFSLTFGSEKRLRKFGIGGPILTYVGSSLIFSLVTMGVGFVPILQPPFESTNISRIAGISLTSSAGYAVQSLFFLLPHLISLLFALFFCYRSYISHKNKLSVY